MPTFAELKKSADSSNQVRKALEGVAFLAPTSAPAITALTDPDGSIKELPEGYVPVGLVSKDGYSFGGSTDTAEVEALGYATPVREDITGRTREISFTAYEVFRKPLLELAYSMDLSSVEQALSGEVMFDQPALPESKEYRLVVIAKDGSGENEVYRAKHFPRVKLVEMPEEAWNSEDAMAFEVQLKALVDDELGTSERDFIAGPGAKADNKLGFNKASA